MGDVFKIALLWLTQSLLVASLVYCPIAATSDQAQYFYDELGRLVGVVDNADNAAVYVYDDVGNLLRIDRFSVARGSVPHRDRLGSLQPSR